MRSALTEDLGACGGITTRILIPADTFHRARTPAREAGVASGMHLPAIAFRLIDPALRLQALAADSDPFAAGGVPAEIEGEAASILPTERVALDLAGRLSGIATQTVASVAETRGTKARITCTRKPTPGLRIVERRAVLHGGGFDHRFGLSDAILVKDNHVAAAGGIRAVLRAVKVRASHMIRTETEVERLDQLAEVPDEGGADVALPDNMDTPTQREAVAMAGGRILLEASGNMRLGRIAEVAGTGVDYISVGALTHSSRTLDPGLDF